MGRVFGLVDRLEDHHVEDLDDLERCWREEYLSFSKLEQALTEIPIDFWDEALAGLAVFADRQRERYETRWKERLARHYELNPQLTPPPS